MIEDHAEQITTALLNDLKTNPRTPTYNELSRGELHRRFFDIYHHLDRWLIDESETSIEESCTRLGKTRLAEDVPLVEVVYALILAKYHLREFINASALLDSAIELYQEKELQKLIGQYFDKAVYYTVQGYMQEVTDRPEGLAASGTR